MTNESPSKHFAPRRRTFVRRARAALLSLTLVVGCASTDQGCTVDLSSCSSDSDCPAAGFLVLYYAPPDCQVDVCREGHCAQEAVADGTPHEPPPFRWRDEVRWCTRHICVSGAVTSIEDENHRPADTKCERYTCSGKDLRTEHLCPELDVGTNDAADGEVASDSSAEAGVDADADDAEASAVDAVDEGGVEDAAEAD